MISFRSPQRADWPLAARVAVLLTAIACASACSGDSTDPDTPENEVGTIQGTIVLSGAGAVANARVRLMRVGQVNALFVTSNAQGQYSTDVPVGQWTVTFVGGRSYTAATDSMATLVELGQVTTVPPFVVSRFVHDVEMRQGAFSPNQIRVGPGAIVRWTNRDDAIHNIFFLPSGDVRSADLATNGQFELIFDTVGVYTYRCQRHPNEGAFVIVE